MLDTVDAARERYHGGPEQIEVIVADNASTDGTGDVARARGCRVAEVEKRIIAASRNGGASIATGEILCFVDADYRIHAETFNAIDGAMRSDRVIGGATGAALERMSPGIFVTVFTILPLLWLTGVDGGVWFCRRADFDEAGGYDETLLISEDVRFLWALQRLGRSRRPKQRLARLSSWSTMWRTMRRPPAEADGDTSQIGVRAIISTRKFDKHGDWHFLRDLVRYPFLLVFRHRRFVEAVESYWYNDRA